MLLAGDAKDEKDIDGNRIKDDMLMIILNAFWEPVQFHLPQEFLNGPCTVILDTRYDRGKPQEPLANICNTYDMEERSLAVLLSPQLEKREWLRTVYKPVNFQLSKRN